MSIIRKIYSVIFLLANLVIQTQAFGALPIPESLVAFDSPDGKILFKRSLNNPFWKLIPYFVTEDGLTFCGVASGVMVLNALQIQPPDSPSHAPYRIFEQNNFFTSSVLKIITPAVINMQGITLEQLSKSIETFGARSTIIYGSDIDIHSFRKKLISAINNNNQYVIVNLHRKYLNEDGGGHFSPLGAYDEKTDRFMLLDVARYKYPIVWVKAKDLYKAIRLNSNGKIEKNRGFLIISKALNQ